MARTHDLINKNKEKFSRIIEEKDTEIALLKSKVEKLEAENKDCRKRLYDAGEGKGERDRLQGIITAQEREKKTLQNQVKELDGSKFIASFIPERQELIKRIRNLRFNNSIFTFLAHRFQSGLEDVIQIAYRIKNNYVEDMDYYTFVFRDSIVGLLEKMLKVLIGKEESSTSKYLVKMRDGEYKLPKIYYDRIPLLKNKDVINNILNLINLQTTAYHGSNFKNDHLVVNKETSELEKANKFLNLNNEDQLNAIFTLLQFMYDVFSNKDSEINLINLSRYWSKTY